MSRIGKRIIEIPAGVTIEQDNDIVPYLLFTGLLKQSIQKKIEESQFSDSEVILCECLGYDKNIKQVLVQRVYETFTL